MIDLPVLDLRDWLGDETTRRGLVDAMDAACTDYGFLQVIGHGISDGVIDGAFASIDEFFALPFETKMACRPADVEINRGYSAKGAEGLAYSLGDDATSDLFEAFNIGPFDVPDDEFHRSRLDRIFAPNIWPGGTPGIERSLCSYFAAAREVAHQLTTVMAASLALPENFFAPATDRSTDVMRVNHYSRDPGEEPLHGQQRMGAHTDYGIVTVLLADPVPGLQIRHDGEWQDVRPSPEALIVNLGDVLAQWTNDRWKSTIHRVVPPSTTTTGPALRRSIAFFHDGNDDALIECLPSCLAPGESPGYAPILAGDHLRAKLLGPRSLRPSNATSTVGARLYSDLTQGDHL